MLQEANLRKSISIPTGTIKRIYAPQHDAACAAISIPTGTIKSIWTHLTIASKIISIPTGTIKSIRNEHRITTFTISIPTGTIKRTPRRLNQRNRTQISIPTGTIKSIILTVIKCSLPDFNSYWYD